MTLRLNLAHASTPSSVEKVRLGRIFLKVFSIHKVARQVCGTVQLHRLLS